MQIMETAELWSSVHILKALMVTGRLGFTVNQNADKSV